MTGTKRQQKTGKVVSFNLSDAARVALSPVVDGKASDAYVFEGKQSGEHVSDQTFRALCKWMADDVLGKDRNDYAAHSTRRTLGTHIYKQTGDVATVARLLGHTNTGATLAYLGVTTRNNSAGHGAQARSLVANTKQTIEPLHPRAGSLHS